MRTVRLTLAALALVAVAAPAAPATPQCDLWWHTDPTTGVTYPTLVC